MVRRRRRRQQIQTDRQTDTLHDDLHTFQLASRTTVSETFRPKPAATIITHFMHKKPLTLPPTAFCSCWCNGPQAMDIPLLSFVWQCVSGSVCSNRQLLFYLTTGRCHFLSSNLSKLSSPISPPPTSAGKWQTTGHQIKERPCIQLTEINVPIALPQTVTLKTVAVSSSETTIPSKRSLPLCAASLIQQVCNCSDNIQLLHALCW
jgi:hypothetical protein